MQGQIFEKSAEYNKSLYDGKTKAVEIKIGDVVLVQNMRDKEGKAKMQRYWEENLFKVSEVKDKVPVYTIINVNNSKDVRVVLRNKLMRVNELPMKVFGDVGDAGKLSGKNQKAQKKQAKPKKITQVDMAEDSESDDNVVLVVEKKLS